MDCEQIKAFAWCWLLMWLSHFKMRRLKWSFKNDFKWSYSGFEFCFIYCIHAKIFKICFRIFWQSLATECKYYKSCVNFAILANSNIYSNSIASLLKSKKGAQKQKKWSRTSNQSPEFEMILANASNATLSDCFPHFCVRFFYRRTDYARS